MILSNIETIPGKNIVSFHGVVTGSTVRAKHLGRDIMASFKNIIGGELKGYTELLQEARQEAIQRMFAQARSVGANAVITDGANTITLLNVNLADLDVNDFIF